MYDDDDEEEEEEVSNESKANDSGKGFGDQFVNLKDAFTLGQAALSLFFFEENQNEKFEVMV